MGVEPEGSARGKVGGAKGTYLELFKVDLVHSLTSKERVQFRRARTGFLEECALLRGGERLAESGKLQLGPRGKVARDDEGPDGSGEGGCEGVDVGRGEEVGGEVGEGREEDGGGGGGGAGREGEESGYVGEKVGGKDELLFVCVLCSLTGVVLVRLDEVEPDEVTVLVLSVNPVVEGVPCDLCCDPLLRGGRDVD